MGQQCDYFKISCDKCLLNTHLATFHPDFSMVTAAVNPERQVIGPVHILRRYPHF
jgi:hypothetical protein